MCSLFEYYLTTSMMQAQFLERPRRSATMLNATVKSVDAEEEQAPGDTWGTKVQGGRKCRGDESWVGRTKAMGCPLGALEWDALWELLNGMPSGSS